MKITNQQHRSIYKLCQFYSESLNDAGIGVQAFMTDRYKKKAIEMLMAIGTPEVQPVIDFLSARSSIDVPWTPQGVLDNIWRPIQKAMTGSDSKTDLDPKDLDAVYRTVDQIISEKTGESIAWPSYEHD